MVFPHANTAIFSAMVAGIAGLWLYCMTHKDWLRGDVMAAVGYSSMAGLGLALALCSWLGCRDEDSSGLVIGMCCLGGLLGFNPDTLHKWVTPVAKQIPLLRSFVTDEKPERPNDSIPDRPSDVFR